MIVISDSDDDHDDDELPPLNFNQRESQTSFLRMNQELGCSDASAESDIEETTKQKAQKDDGDTKKEDHKLESQEL